MPLEEIIDRLEHQAFLIDSRGFLTEKLEVGTHGHRPGVTQYRHLEAGIDIAAPRLVYTLPKIRLHHATSIGWVVECNPHRMVANEAGAMLAMLYTKHLAYDG